MSGEGLSQTALDDAIETALEEGFIVFQSSPTSLLLDIDIDRDNGAALRQYERVLPLAFEKFGVEEKERWNSKSGTNLHIRLEIPYELPFGTRTLLQCALGSDAVREVLGYVSNTEFGVKEPSVLFRPPASLTHER